MRKLAPMLLLLVLAPGILLADELKLRGGGSVTGVIVARTATEVKVDIGAGVVTVKTSSIASIVPGTSDLSEYRQRAAALKPEDVEGWRALARWAASKGLGAQAKEAWGQVLTRAPMDAEANQATGRVLVDNRWVSREEAYRAQGYVQFEGEWMPPDERQHILDQRAQQAQADQQALQAQVAEEDAAHQAHVQADQAYWEKARLNEMPSGGGIVYWDGGVGPQLVPDQPGSSWP